MIPKLSDENSREFVSTTGAVDLNVLTRTLCFPTGRSNSSKCFVAKLACGNEVFSILFNAPSPKAVTQ